jgi:Heavy metal associated domain 2
MPQRQRAYVVHRTAGRLRIKIPAQRRNEAFFAHLRRQLALHEEIVGVEANPLTGSVVIWHRNDFDLGDLHCAFLGLDFGPDFASSEPLAEPGSLDRRRSAERIGKLDGWIRTLTGGELDLASVVLKLAVAIVTRQSGLQLLGWFAKAVLAGAIKSLADQARRMPAAIASGARPVLFAA